MTEPDRPIGRMERAVRAELELLDKTLIDRSPSLAEGARILAQAMDMYAAEAESAAQLSAIIKANQEVRAILNALKRAGQEEGGDDPDADSAGLSAAFRDPSESGSGIVRESDSGGGGSAG